jgi:hypothetical protein
MLIKLKFCRQILVKAQIESFTKIRPVAAALFHADGRTDGRTGVTMLTVAFCKLPDLASKAHLTGYTMGYAVAQSDEALPYKLEGRGFDSPRCHLNFSLT